MLHKDHAIFIACIHSKKKMTVRFFSNKEQTYLTRTIAPMDFGPKRGESPPIDRYHIWDFDSPSKPHPSSLEPSQIQLMVALDEAFDPAVFVTWTPSWHVSRNWGTYS